MNAILDALCFRSHLGLSARHKRLAQICSISLTLLFAIFCLLQVSRPSELQGVFLVCSGFVSFLTFGVRKTAKEKLTFMLFQNIVCWALTAFGVLSFIYANPPGAAFSIITFAVIFSTIHLAFSISIVHSFQNAGVRQKLIID